MLITDLLKHLYYLKAFKPYNYSNSSQGGANAQITLFFTDTILCSIYHSLFV